MALERLKVDVAYLTRDGQKAVIRYISHNDKVVEGYIGTDKQATSWWNFPPHIGLRILDGVNPHDLVSLLGQVGQLELFDNTE